MLPPLRIAVLISGTGSNLNALIQAQKRGLNIEICAIISNNPQALGLEIAKKNHLPYEIINHQDFFDRANFDCALQKSLDAHQPELIILAGFMRLLTAPFIHHFQGRLINIHPSLLPRYKGLHTFEKAIKNQDDKHGSTVHYVTLAMDEGAIISQISFNINEIKCPQALQAVTKTHEHQLLPWVVNLFAQRRLSFRDDRCYLDKCVVPKNGINFNEIIA